MKKLILKCFSLLFSRTRLTAAIVTGVLILATIAAASIYYTSIIGGSGGTSYSLSCGSDKALVGIDGRAGNLVDRVQGLCAQINYDGSWQGNWMTTGTAGGTGGTSYGLRCQNGYAVTGISGRAGSYIDQMTLWCARVGFNGRIAFAPTASNTVGGTGGQWFSISCSDAMPARLIKGRASTWVDAMGLGCDYVTPLKILSISVPSTPLRTGQTVSAAVTMSLKPAANAVVSLTSSNASAAPVPSNLTVGTNSTQGTVSITPSASGCATITASYKGSSASLDITVDSPTSPYLSLTGPSAIKTGSTVTMTVTIPSPAPAEGKTIVLGTVDPSNELNIVSFPIEVRIPPNAVSATFQVTGKAQGCARITAAVPNQYRVTHTVMAEPALSKLNFINPIR